MGIVKVIQTTEVKGIKAYMLLEAYEVKDVSEVYSVMTQLARKYGVGRECIENIPVDVDCGDVRIVYFPHGSEESLRLVKYLLGASRNK